MSGLGSTNLGVQVQVGAVAMLLDKDRKFLGTCFPFRWRHRFLTARHNVGDRAADDLIVHSQGGRDFRVVEIHHNSDADVSLLEGDPSEGGVPYPFSGLYVFEGTFGIGEEIVTFGFPEGGTLEEPYEPMPRIFRGFTQRMATFASGGSKPHRAYELSFPAPLGLSGGPVFVPGSDGVFAMVTGVIETFSILGELTVEKIDATSFAKPSHRLIGYGMALSLWQHQQWLAEVSPLAGDRRW